MTDQSALGDTELANLVEFIELPRDGRDTP
jgi:hypothetical protein